jgi:hypothetical protein
MTASDNEFRQVLRGLLELIDGGTPAPSPGVLALEVARRHRLSPLLATIETGAPELAAACYRDRTLTAARGLLFRQVAERLLASFAEARLPVIVLKGLAYQATLYPVGARPTSDIDLLVPNEARRDAFALLDRLGFEPRAAAPGFDDADYHEVAWRGQGVEIDLHLALAPFARCEIDYRAVWDRAVSIQIGEAPVRALDPTQAAVFHALHMAIDHFDVPALYLVDFARLLADEGRIAEAEATARAWRCWRPFETALALTAHFMPRSLVGRLGRPAPPFARGVVASYGGQRRVVRSAQLVRKFRHFDVGGDALRYILVQGRRNVRELYQRHVLKRSARERLALG